MEESTHTKNGIIIILLILVSGLAFVIFNSANNDISNNTEGVVLDGSVEEHAENNEIDDVEIVVPVTQVKKSAIESVVETKTIVQTPSIDATLVIVTYTDSGFIPPVVEVEAGKSIMFINSSSKPMWVTSEYHPTAKAQVYRSFDQSKSVSNGGTYIFTFTKVGVWGYKNLNFEKHLGAVSVIPQP